MFVEARHIETHSPSVHSAIFVYLLLLHSYGCWRQCTYCVSNTFRTLHSVFLFNVTVRRNFLLRIFYYDWISNKVPKRIFGNIASLLCRLRVAILWSICECVTERFLPTSRTLVMWIHRRSIVDYLLVILFYFNYLYYCYSYVLVTLFICLALYYSFFPHKWNI